MPCAPWARRAGLRCALLLALLPGQSAGLDQPFARPEVSALGMGGVGQAISSDASGSLANPAAALLGDRGWRLNLISVQAASSPGTVDFVDDLDRALAIDDDIAQAQAVIDVLDRYRGDSLHADAGARSQLLWRGRGSAVALTATASTGLEARSSHGYSSAGLLGVDAWAWRGGAATVATRWERVAVGFSVKQLDLHRLLEEYTVRELIDRAEAGGLRFKDDVEQGQAVAADAGLLVELAPGSDWAPRLGVSWLNLGGVDFGAAGRLPASYNLGLSIVRPWLGGFRAALDLTDIGGQLREADLLMRMRLGLELHLWRGTWSALALRTGLYDGAPTAGVEVTLAGIGLAVSTYAAETGAYAGQDPDRRLAAGLQAAW